MPKDKVDLSYAFTLEPKDAIKYFRKKGYVIGWNWQDVATETHAKAFTVAKAARLDILKTIRKEIDKALISGTTQREFVNTLTPRLKKLGWWGKQVIVDSAGAAEMVQLGSPWRLKNIYRTNMQTSYMAGRYQQQMDLKESRPYWMYVAVMDENTRASHSALNNKVFSADDPIWKTHYPPNGWGCRCRVRALSERRLQSMGLPVESSRGRLSTATVETGFNKRTGEVYTDQVTSYQNGKQVMTPDPGWNSRPGNEHLKQLKTETAKKEKALKNPPESLSSDWVVRTPAPFSTAKNVNGEAVNRLFNALGTEDTRKALADFMAIHPIKACMLKATELGGKKAWRNEALQKEIADYLGVAPEESFRQYGRVRSGNRVNGYTRSAYDLVMIKVKANSNLKKADPEKIRQAVRDVLESARKNNGPHKIYAPLSKEYKPHNPDDYLNRHWSISNALGEKSQERIMTTLIHELGHQVHFWGKSPVFQKQNRISDLTKYGRSNDKEWFAEHFSAWYIDPEGVRQWNPEAADFIEATLKEATLNTDPRLKGS